MQSDLEIAREISSNIHQQYPSSEFYLECSKKMFSANDLTDRGKFIHHLTENSQRIEFFKSYGANRITVSLHSFMENWCPRGKNIDLTFARYVSSALILGQGECGELSSLLFFRLMQKNISPIGISEINVEGSNHLFVEFNHENKYWILDPFFDIFCPKEEYFNHPKLIAYFQFRRAPQKINSEILKQNTQEWIPFIAQDKYAHWLPTIEKIVGAFTAFDYPEITALKEDVATLKKIHQNPNEYNLDIVFALLKRHALKKDFDTNSDADRNKCEAAYLEACLASNPNKNQKALLALLQTCSYQHLFSLAEFIFKEDKLLQTIKKCLYSHLKYTEALINASSLSTPENREKIFKFTKVLLAAQVLNKEDMDKFSDKGYTALHYAALNDDEPLYELLKTVGANPHITSKNDKQETPLEILAGIQKQKLIEKIPSVKEAEKVVFYKPAPEVVSAVVVTESTKTASFSPAFT